jgi:hypothetical protein
MAIMWFTCAVIVVAVVLVFVRCYRQLDRGMTLGRYMEESLILLALGCGLASAAAWTYLVKRLAAVLGL